MFKTKAILAVIGASNGSMAYFATQVLEALSKSPNLIEERLDLIARHSLNDPQVELTEDDQAIVKGWLKNK